MPEDLAAKTTEQRPLKRGNTPVTGSGLLGASLFAPLLITTSVLASSPSFGFTSIFLGFPSFFSPCNLSSSCPERNAQINGKAYVLSSYRQRATNTQNTRTPMSSVHDVDSREMTPEEVQKMIPSLSDLLNSKGVMATKSKYIFLNSK